MRDLNTFVYAAAQTGCVDEGQHAAEALRGRVSDYPWRYFADDVTAAYEGTVKQLTG